VVDVGNDGDVADGAGNDSATCLGSKGRAF